MAKKKIEAPVEEIIPENIQVLPLEEVMDDRYAIYAKYVIQDRAIPDVRDGLKPVQRRIIFSMYKSGNTFNKPTKKCAHTVGAVMGTFHPHGDTSIYEALARMSQDWKVRYPLIDFQGNNGSIDGDSPAAYRYTESRLSDLSNEMIKDIDKKTVDMQLNFDDTEFEPVVLPSRFPNLLVNGTEGIAVAIATEIPPHNLRELTEAIIYRIGHKTATVDDLMQFVPGPDFPGGGIIYNSDGLKSIYTTGHGRIEIASKCEIVANKDNQQIIITEIPYKIVKKDLVFEIDKIIHSKVVDGLLEIRDESDWKGIRIVIDCKKDANCELLLKYLMNKSTLVSSYTANMVAICDGKPRTLDLLSYVDYYIAHQVDVITRRSKFDLDKYKARLHIVEGLIKASININDVVNIIRKSKDKADSKVNLMNAYGFSNEQAEAIVTMPLYKLSHTDEITLEAEAEQLKKDIEILIGILEDPQKLNRVLIKDLKALADKYGDDRRTQFQEKGEVEQIDKRQLIAKDDVMIAVTRDGYIKRSTIKSYRSSGENVAPGMKDGDVLVTVGQAVTIDYLVCFTNKGNYICIPVHKIPESRWKEEGVHLNEFATLDANDKIIKCICVSEFRNDLYLAILTKFGQIKRMNVSAIESAKRSRAIRYMKLLNEDEVVGIQVLTGNSDLLVITSNGFASLFNENDLSIIGPNASGVKSISGLGKNQVVALMAFDENEKDKVVVVTDKGHYRVLDNTKVIHTQRLGKTTLICPSFKGEPHKIVYAGKVNGEKEMIKLDLVLDDKSSMQQEINDLHLSDLSKYAKKNMDITAKQEIIIVNDLLLDHIDKTIVSRPLPVKENKSLETENSEVSTEQSIDSNEEKEGSFEQISIFDDLDE